MIAFVRFSRKRNVKLTADLTGPTEVKVGLPAGKAGSDLVSIAIWNHYGTRGGGWGGPIRARPFLMQAIRGNRKKYLEFLRSSSSGLIRGESSLGSVLAKLGAMAQGDIQKEITSGSFAPNSPVTIALKGSSRPLIDTGRLRNSITWEIKK